MSVFSGLLGGGLSVATDIVSSNILAGVLTLTTQRDLVLMITVELLVIFSVTEGYLMRVFARSDALSPLMERTLLHFITLPKLAFAFVILRLSMPIVTEQFETSQIRWNDIVVGGFLLLSVFFLIVERNRLPLPLPTPALPLTTPATVAVEQ